ncbi:MFS transporter [uncultured Roseibium sp.]|uniref:MFS transporter n=1 Tax=uncultured Roseibium sp. TaxID=1936171 RepID=UPI00260F8CE3|nr:MFS transporter [uncultured Roseibium sp.]
MAVITEDNRKWWLLVAVSCVLGLVLLDETVVGVALPTIEEELGLSVNQSHWVVNSYLLVFACFVAVGGKLGDQFGMLPMFLIGLLVFGLCSVIGGFAPSGHVLITARSVQGIGAAIIFPLFVAMITMTFPKEQRGFALGVGGAIGTIFLSLGPLAGGLLTDLLSWRWIFWINPPIVVLIGLIAFLTWRDVDRPKAPPIDWTGLALIASGMFCTIFSLMQSEVWGWTSPLVYGLFAAGIGLLMVFVWYELRVAAPLIEVDLFVNPAFLASNLTIFMAQYSKMPIFIFAAMYAQEVLGLSPLGAGLLVMLAAITQPFVAPYCGKLTDSHEPGLLATGGMVGLGIAMALMAITAPLDTIWLFAIGVIITGLAMPFVFVPTQTAIMASLPEHKHGQGGGISMTSQMIGGTVGLAISGTLFAFHKDYALVFASTAVLLFVLAVICFILFRKSVTQSA